MFVSFRLLGVESIQTAWISASAIMYSVRASRNDDFEPCVFRNNDTLFRLRVVGGSGLKQEAARPWRLEVVADVAPGQALRRQRGAVRRRRRASIAGEDRGVGARRGRGR